MLKRLRFDERTLIAALLLTLAVLVRLRVRGFESGDFVGGTSVWYAALKERGWRALAEDYFYTPPYLYALYAVSLVLPGVYPVFATKIPSLAADFVCAFYAYRVARIRFPDASLAPVLGALALLFAPTVLLNSAVWGQMDMLYTAPLVASLYYLLRHADRAAWVAFGIAFSIKLQAVFLAPLFFVLLLRRRLRWRDSLIAPATYLLCILPAWLVGRPLWQLLATYFRQVEGYTKLSMHAPSLYAWLPDAPPAMFVPAGVLFGLAVVFLLVVVAWKSPVTLGPTTLLRLALVFAVVTPFVLPKMHQRYFFQADVIALVLSFYCPRDAWLALLISLVSFFAYLPFLFHTEIVGLAWLALALLVGIVVLLRQTLAELFPWEPWAPPVAPPSVASFTSASDDRRSGSNGCSTG